MGANRKARAGEPNSRAREDRMVQSSEEQIKRFVDLIAGYDDVVSRCGPAASRELLLGTMEVNELLDGFEKARSAWATNQVARADDFNLLRVMGVADDEVTHSRVLAWLLDRRLDHGTHAQGDLGFRLFIEALGLELGAKSVPQIMSYPTHPYWVRCEVSGGESRVDIEIAAREQFIIHIENKIHSCEGDDQTNREWRDIERRAEELGVPGSNTHGIFLTLDGRRSENTNFVPISWRSLADVLDKFAEQAQADEVKLFAMHYAKSIRQLILEEPESRDDKDEDPTVQRPGIVPAK
jgi:hypothetical protein